MGIIGSAFLGYTRVYGAGGDRLDLDIPTNGLVAWYDASNFTNGDTVWTDASGNGLDLTINGTVTRDDDVSIPYISLTNATEIYLQTPTTLISGDTDVTIVMLNDYGSANDPGVDGGTWSLGDGELSNRIRSLRSDNCSPTDSFPVAGLWHTNGPRVDGTYYYDLGDCQQPRGRLPYGSYPAMYAYRASSVSSVLDSSLKINIATQFLYDEISITDTLSLDQWQASGDMLYDFGNSAEIRIGQWASGETMINGKLGAAIFYNRQLSDSELQQIADHYDNYGINPSV